jgi:glucokinase
VNSSTNSTIACQIIGLDLGGTKCAVSHVVDGRVVEVLRIPTGEYANTFAALTVGIRLLRDGRSLVVGVSCGGPLDRERGIILSPPNLHETWYGVPICRVLTEAFGGRACLMNDANACALAEWKYGAGRGARHMIFLTSGTGMGGGLILNGELYEGATGDAGEIGHVRLSPDGPMGFGKLGSVEGFCSGGGIARLAEHYLRMKGERTSPCLACGTPLTTKHLAEAARAGNALAMEVMTEAGSRLGDALAIIIDLLNPDRIVLGGFFPLCQDLLEPSANRSLENEALPTPRSACLILPAELGETIGSHGAIAAALYRFNREPAN